MTYVFYECDLSSSDSVVIQAHLFLAFLPLTTSLKRSSRSSSRQIAKSGDRLPPPFGINSLNNLENLPCIERDVLVEHHSRGTRAIVTVSTFIHRIRFFSRP